MHLSTGEKAKNPVESLQWRRRPENADFCPLSWLNLSGGGGGGRRSGVLLKIPGGGGGLLRRGGGGEGPGASTGNLGWGKGGGGRGPIYREKEEAPFR